MGRRGGGGGRRRSFSTSRSSSSFFSKKTPTKTPDKDEKAPPPAKVDETRDGVSRPGGFFESISDGFGFGSGSAMGRRFADAIFGPRTIRLETVSPEKVEVAAVSTIDDDNEKLKEYSESCKISYDAFQDCLNIKGNNLRKCHFFMDLLFECKRNSSSYNF